MKPSEFIKEGKRLMKSREPFMVTGPPGVGKTECFLQMAKENDMDAIVFHPVVDDPTDYKGLPARVGDHAEFLPYGNLLRLMDVEKETAVLFDDNGQAEMSVQKAEMQVIHAREINGKRLSDKVTLCAATNERAHRAGVSGMISPLLDRFTTIVSLDFDIDDWSKWALQHDLPWELVSYNRFKPEQLAKFEPPGGISKTTTPRSVAGLGRLWKAGVRNFEILQGCCDKGYVIEFLAHAKVAASLPSIDSILLDPHKAPVPEEPEVKYALVGALAHKANKSNFEVMRHYLSRLDPEFSVRCVKDMLAQHSGIHACKAYVEWATENKDILGLDEEGF